MNVHMLFKFLLVLILSFPVLISINSCKGKSEKKKFVSPPGYDLEHPYRMKLPPELDEISGIVYYPKDSSIFCIADEFGLLYKVYLNKKKKVIKWKFSKDGDYEDLLLLDSNFYALKSKGSFLKIRFHTGESIQVDTIAPLLKGKNEFEIVYYNEQEMHMVLICKDCEADNKNKVSAIAFDPVTKAHSIAFVLQEKEIEKRLGDKLKFKPSAAGIHPVTNELFIISSVNNALVICDTKGNVQSVYKIDKAVFKQPEGLAFTPTGDLLISNESGDSGPANILYFKFKRKG